MRRIGFLIFNGIQSLDLSGPWEAFHVAGGLGGGAYEKVLIGPTAAPVQSSSGLTFVPSETFATAGSLDTLVIPGGSGARDTEIQAQVCPWICTMAARTPRVMTVCTGSFLLAASGLLTGKRATTHWRHVDEFRAKHPHVVLEDDALFLHDGKFYTSAGVTAGIDLALKLIEDDYGPQVALTVARQLVVYFRRGGTQAQFSEPLRFQARAMPLFAELAAWMLANLHQELRIDVLAKRVGMSPRNFCRKFKAEFQDTPARYVERLRLDYARQLLEQKDWRIEEIAQACGFDNSDRLRRSFRRHFALSPIDYRRRFAASQPAFQ